MKKLLLFISSYEGEKSNSYYIADYIERKLLGRVKCTKILLSDRELDYINYDFRNCDNIIFITSLRKDEFNRASKKFLEAIREENKKKDYNKEIKFSAILNGDLEVLSGIEKIENLLENCMEICNKKYIVWQKGIGVLARLNLWESGLENNDLEYDQLLIELEMFCQDIVNEKMYHHNSFAIPKKGSGFLKFINNRIKQFT
ncbi:hypothetical protein QTH11_04765 [Clostridium perfringens]|uniref:hypothetical protein n=2 Tax=Clostridium perfringens TaxID=1502 RepID=UPI001D8B93E9|nr:hypothetical protein [Clostridium perfringens]MBS5967548.1 hypothetical protein [Clostridium perfringens]MDK0685351.1 hypothetical protein [Clostridium perfringens]MDK0795481.1 hypothetical protein [Clostridium perfringens]MDM0465768.1 hypothetical protein [Clostridium perfringens]